MKKTLVSMLTLVALFGSLCLNAQTTDIKPPKNSILSGQQQIMNERLPRRCPKSMNPMSCGRRR